MKKQNFYFAHEELLSSSTFNTINIPRQHNSSEKKPKLTTTLAPTDSLVCVASEEKELFPSPTLKFLFRFVGRRLKKNLFSVLKALSKQKSSFEFGIGWSQRRFLYQIRNRERSSSSSVQKNETWRKKK
jgi:hypothetical protein